MKQSFCSGSHVLHYFCLILLALGLTSCKTTKPSSDSTPPKITWRYVNSTTGKEQDLKDDAGPIEISETDRMVVTCFANDSGGVHKISLKADALVDCKTVGSQPLVQDNLNRVLMPLKEQILNPSADNTVLTKIFLNHQFVLKEDVACGTAGFTVYAGDITFTATAENYFGGVTKNTLKFKAK